MSAKEKSGMVPSIIRLFMWLFLGLKWLGITIVVMIAILVSYVIYMSGKVSYPMSVNTTDTEIVQINLGSKVPLYIPKSYLSWRHTWKGGNQEVAEIGAMLPDMEPVALAPEIIEEDRLYISLEGGYENRIVFYTQEAEAQYKKLSPYLEDTPFGLKKLDDNYYADKAAGKIGSMAFFKNNDYFLARFSDGRRIKISCEKTAPRCRVSKDFDGRISGSYSVHRSYIPDHWKEVDDKVSALISNFYQE